MTAVAARPRGCPRAWRLRAARPTGWRWRTAPAAPRGRRGSIRRSPGGSCRCRASRRRTTHVVDPLPERVRLVAAPGELRDVELAVLGWRTEDGEVALRCRLIDGSAGTIPARWTDLPARAAEEHSLGVLASPAAWRLLAERLGALRSRRPVRAAACGDDRDERVGPVGVGGGRTDAGGRGGVGDAAAGVPTRGDGSARAAAGAVGGGRA